MFSPFYPQETETFGLLNFFEKIYNFQEKLNLTNYIQYLKLLSKTYHDNIPIDKTAFIALLTELLISYHLVSIGKTDPAAIKDLQQSLQKELYGK